jgi:predicted chitinase
MAGLQDTRQQKLPSFADAQKIIQAHKADYALRNTETGDVMPMRLSPMSKQVREVFPKPVEAEPVAQPIQQRQPAPATRPARGWTPDDYRQAYIRELRQAGYSDRATATALGIAEGETDGFRKMTENARYTSPQRIAKVFPELKAKAKGLAAMDSERQYNTFYAGKLGNAEPGDGYRYRGRGNVHLTGRQGYADVDQRLGLGGQLLKNPDLIANDPQMAARSAMAYLDGKLDGARDFDMKTGLKAVGGAKSSWKRKTQAANGYLNQFRASPMMASNP